MNIKVYQDMLCIIAFIWLAIIIENLLGCLASTLATCDTENHPCNGFFTFWMTQAYWIRSFLNLLPGETQKKLEKWEEARRNGKTREKTGRNGKKWEETGRYPKSIQKVSKKYLKSIQKVSKNYTKNILKVF